VKFASMFINEAHSCLQLPTCLPYQRHGRHDECGVVVGVEHHRPVPGMESSSRVVFNLGDATPWGSFAFFLGVARAFDKNILNSLYFHVEPLLRP